MGFFFGVNATLYFQFNPFILVLRLQVPEQMHFFLPPSPLHPSAFLFLLIIITAGML